MLEQLICVLVDEAPVLSLTPQQRSEITTQLNEIRARLHALEIPSEPNLDAWKALYVEKRRFERMLAEDRWLDESDDVLGG